MATMIPGVVSEHTRSQAEVDIFGIIKQELPPEWTAYHSVGLAIHGKKPWAESDFILVGPPGVFVLEVKGKRVRRERGMWIYTTGAGRDSEPKAEGPFDQAGGAASALYKYLSERLPGFRRSMVGFGVVTPDIVFRVEGPDIILEVVYDADDARGLFTTYMDRVAAYWRDRLAALKGSRPAPLDARLCEQVCDLIRPDFDARVSLRARADRVNKELLRLTTQQYRVLDGLAANDRAIVMGAAGTGKTLLAVEETARFSRAGRKVALLCYNRALADNLRQVTSGMPGVMAASIHSVMRDLIRRAGLEGDLPDADESDLFEVFYPALAFRALVDDLVPDRYDAVVLDEGQDLLTVRFLDVVEALLSGGLAAGQWRVFYDPRQDLFGAAEPAALKRLRGLAASFSLSVNCRNTQPIGAETGLLCGFLPSETLVAEGPEVRRHWCTDEREQARLLGKDINNLLIGGFDKADIVVLGRRRLANTSLSGSIPGIPFRLWEGRQSEMPKNAIHYSTISAFKGLEADAVFVVDVDELLDPEAAARLYVATSRARSNLFLYFQGDSKAQYQERAAELGERLAELA
jgi:hypothetical protein